MHYALVLPLRVTSIQRNVSMVHGIPHKLEWACVIPNNVLQAATSVSQGYHRNLSTALSDLYQNHIGSFLAEALSTLAGNRLDLLTLMHACQECEASGGAVDSIYTAFASLCVTRSIAELPALASQVHYIQVRHVTPQSFNQHTPSLSSCKCMAC